ncbi:neuronal acetylcholine receptor subunit alpha-10-like [Chroicocephalus ridibundus]|uniref:neuronal acetylcholine receptor subunit alpha-10-like n=1 Tax=Chroicocephalus ridibundus TaxID=1192867 RepID=UPI002FDDF2A9
MSQSFGITEDVPPKVNQVLTSYLWVRQAWLDAHLAWDKDAYGGIDSIRIPSSYVWRPAIIILYNDANDGFGGSVETNVVLRSDGHITWDSPAITKSSCKVDVSYLPFDGQRCRLTFGSWTYNGNQIDLHNRLDTGDLTDFVENVEWVALGMPANSKFGSKQIKAGNPVNFVHEDPNEDSGKIAEITLLLNGKTQITIGNNYGGRYCPKALPNLRTCSDKP